MANKKTISRRAALFGGAGGLLSFLGIQPDDSFDEAAGKVVAGTAIGTAVGAGIGLVDKAHDKIKPEPSDRYLQDSERYREGMKNEHYRNKPVERQKDRHNDDPRER